MTAWRRTKILAGLLLTFTPCLPAQDASSFQPLQQWKNAVLSRDVAALTTLFSTQPAAQVAVGKGSIDVATEANFWTGMKAQKMDLDINQFSSPQPGVQIVVFQAEIHKSGSSDQELYVSEAQAWQQQSGQWRIVMAKRTEPAHLKQPADTKKDLYPANVDARAEIKEAEEKASKEHKRVLLVFGANWCFDCHVLDLAFHRPDFAPIVAHYEVVHVDIGDDGKKNADIAKQYEVPLGKGVPALAVLDASGKLLVSQKNGEFENARAMTPDVIREFLDKWKPQT
jgi:ketosteroid isomerase-like protein